MLSGSDVRKKFLYFLEKQGHKIVPSSSILPENDSSTLFISSGMQPLIPYFLGQKHPAGSRITNSQKCFRSGDIEEVGDGRHNTFFEMLGNWSFGDYFKDYQLSNYFNFLTKEINLDPNRLYVTVFRGNDKFGLSRDIESVNIWKKLFNDVGIEAVDINLAEVNGMKDGRIFYYGEEKNWWSRSGIPQNMPEGEIGGCDSEVFYDLGANLHRHEESIWKNEPCHVNCDCGRFIEIGNSVFMEFKKTADGFEKLAQKNIDFGGGLERTVMAVQGKDNVFETDLFSGILDAISVASGGKKYTDHRKEFEIISDHIKAAVFIIGDNKGIRPSNVDQGYLVRRLLRRAIRYGRSLGIVEDIWLSNLAEAVIASYSNEYRELEQNKNFVLNSIVEEERKFSRTLEKGLKKIGQIIDSKGEKNIIKEIEDGDLSFDVFQTYGFPVEMLIEEVKSKGMVIDEGRLVDNFRLKMSKHQDLSKTASVGKFKGGLEDSSEETKKLHTAAHLLLAALRMVLGDHVYQKGSNITAERLRFDFSHNDKITDDQKREIEKIVNDKISDKMEVVCEEIPLEEAKKRGAMGVFESKYGDMVKVYKIGNGKEIFSYEICGGPHVDNLSQLGKFRIDKESSSSAGVRRIKAVLE